MKHSARIIIMKHVLGYTKNEPCFFLAAVANLFIERGKEKHREVKHRPYGKLVSIAYKPY